MTRTFSGESLAGVEIVADTESCPVTKSDVGPIGALGKSKKFGLVSAFVATCLGSLTQTASIYLQVAFVAAATAGVLGYVIGQSLVEAAAAAKPKK